MATQQITPWPFPNGLTLTSTAFTPETLNSFFQVLIAQILGFAILNPPEPGNTTEFNKAAVAKAFYAVRVGWQTEGQPFGKVGEDICYIRCTPTNPPFSRTRDGFLDLNSADPSNITLRLNQAYTEVWELHCVCYGPNAYARASIISDALSLDWAAAMCQAQQLYPVASWDRPMYTREKFQGQWWPRADLKRRFNELVTQSMIVPKAASVEVTIQTTNVSESVLIDAE